MPSLSDTVLDDSRVAVVGETDWTTAVADALRSRTDSTVDAVDTAPAALELVRTDAVDAVLTAREVGDSTGIDLVRGIRDTTTTLPVLLGTAAGSESLASEAIEAGVTDYVVVDGPLDEVVEDTLGRTEEAIRAAQRKRTRRDRARQFDATFDDARTATWVLDPDGTLTRVNGVAREMVDADTDAVVGQPFWTLPWWPDDDTAAADVRRLVETARNGEFGQAVVTRDGVTGDRVFELSVRPVKDERGRLVSIVVDGMDIGDRVDLERELRQSEELHRVTLNNMTDTVLMTDEDGEYTYVCPNVHFIFGYTADEIRELGTIDELLGDDLFDREALAETGVLKNIEITATDKAGREHTLLVNVREVSIQDGTLLYSCRDITKRKQREQALATLQETARDFLYAETHQEIAQHVVDDTASVLDLDAGAVYLFDADDNHLQPAAQSPGMREANGPLPTVHADGRDLTSHSFVEDEALFFDDVHADDRLQNPATDLRSAAYIPLGNHGVFIAGTTEVGAFDDVTRELADLLAATAEAALDRVSRESQLREQDRELQHRNEQLTTLNRINETIREIDGALVRSETREEIDHTVCERLTAEDRFRFAWIGTVDAATETVNPATWAGAEEGYIDSQSFPVAADGVEPAGRAAATGEVTLVSNVAADLRAAPWRKAAISRDFLSVLSIPLVYNDLTYGVLTVYAETPDAFDDPVRTVLGELGETIASAISASERKRALLTTSMTRVDYAVSDRSFVLTQLAGAADCTLSYEGGVQQTANGNYVFVTVEDAPVDSVVDAAAGLVLVDDVQEIRGGETGGVVRLQLSKPFLATELADHGAILQTAAATGSGTELTIDVPGSVDTRHVSQFLRERFGEVELTAKQTREQASEHGFYASVLERLTDRQLEVLETAYYSGFFETPRRLTGEEVAESLDISPQGFYQHVRTVQRKLFAALIDDHAPVTTAHAD
ncbi:MULTISPECIES: bacterio-opsin activator domain-containing protein [Halolamina]|uniref:PAS domain S-box-containing protein n=1 Tax=Halolamina pelagica TaxID=699431 RepID=A0A1I5V7V8_9EURY|nr:MULTISPECIES: bacterio-opsin activator domain-containing protein [Halolamina]NHX37916.1 GAF domain-containing protein [Halolamina sp. R1-12]SFQ03447.1 PAS domain S-box-containing protein [Halolamina pelagica]